MNKETSFFIEQLEGFDFFKKSKYQSVCYFGSSLNFEMHWSLCLKKTRLKIVLWNLSNNFHKLSNERFLDFCILLSLKKKKVVKKERLVSLMLFLPNSAKIFNKWEKDDLIVLHLSTFSKMLRRNFWIEILNVLNLSRYTAVPL